MRFGFAIASLVLSGILLILGIGQRTFLAGPAEIVYSAELPSGSQYAVISGDAFAAEDGQANVVVSGEGAFAAVGSAIDVEAWVSPVAHAVLAVDQQSTQLVGTEVDAAKPAAAAEDAEAPEVLDPRGSDLWFDERSLVETDGEAEAAASGEAGTVRLPVATDGEDAVLIAVAEDASAPAAVSIAWVQDQRTPLAGPFLAAGALFAALGGVLYLIAVDHDRRGLGPRRGRKGPLLGIRDSLFGRRRRAKETPATEPEVAASGPQAPASAPEAAQGDRATRSTTRRVALPALWLTLALGLSGCSADYWPDFSQEPAAEEGAESADTTAVAPAPVTRGQIDRIVADIAAVAGEADDALDPELLKSRFTGDALSQRSANYKIRAAVPDYAIVPSRITDETLGYELVQSTEGWPRTVFVTVASETAASDAAEQEADAEDATADEAASPSLALIMSQASPHENFLVSRVVALRGGITMPEAAPADEGTALLGDDLQSLVLAPKEVGPAYAAVLVGGPESEQAKQFDLTGDTLIERSGAAWVAQAQAAADAAGQGVTYSVSAKQADTKIISLSTGVGGALVATTVIEERSEEPGSSRWRPTPSASITALTGLTGQQDRLISEVSHQLLFYVPSKTSSAPIQMLGFSSDLVGARN